jgi:hypothetical protein
VALKEPRAWSYIDIASALKPNGPSSDGKLIFVLRVRLHNADACTRLVAIA